jgi:hypothetical protein
MGQTFSQSQPLFSQPLVVPTPTPTPAPAPKPLVVDTKGNTPQELQVVAASDCRTPPNAFNDLMGKISSCATGNEKDQIQKFGERIINLQQEIKDAQSAIDNSLANGDLLFGTNPHNEIIQQLIERNKDLKAKKQSLIQQIKEKEAIIDRSNRDFQDVKKTVPEPQPKKVLRFVEDYTMAVLVISYLFMIVSSIYLYVYQSEYKLLGLVQSTFAAALLSGFLYLFFSR